MTIKAILNGKMTDFDDMTRLEQIEVFGEAFCQRIKRLRERKEKLEIEMIDVSCSEHTAVDAGEWVQ